MIRVVGTSKENKQVGSIIDTESTLEAVKIFIEKLEETEKTSPLASIEIDSDIEYI